MNGLELSKRYFEEYGRDLVRQFDPDGNLISAGLSGYGSECAGFDDETSRDHDFEPRFSLYYADRGGVVTVRDFFETFTGLTALPETAGEWLRIPEYALFAAVNGEIYVNGCKEFATYRETLETGMPLDVRRKKLAARLAIMAQSGQYNYPRMLKRGETGAAALAAAEFVSKGLETLFILNKSYAPYYKWLFKAAKGLNKLGYLADDFERVLTAPNDNEKALLIERISADIAAETVKQGYSDAVGDYLEPHAVSTVSKMVKVWIKLIR